MERYKILYNDKAVISFVPLPKSGAVRASKSQGVKSLYATLEAARTMLSAIGVDTTKLTR